MADIGPVGNAAEIAVPVVPPFVEIPVGQLEYRQAENIPALLQLQVQVYICRVFRIDRLEIYRYEKVCVDYLPAVDLEQFGEPGNRDRISLSISSSRKIMPGRVR